jgi:hypothetical protein
MGKTTPALDAGDRLARNLIPIIKKMVARALPREEQPPFLLEFLSRLFGFLAARYSAQTTVELIDARDQVVRYGDENVFHLQAADQPFVLCGDWMNKIVLHIGKIILDDRRY